MFTRINEIMGSINEEQERINKGQKAAKRRARVALSELTKEAKRLRAELNQKEEQE